MCTAITFKSNGNYFGRNLDLEYSLDEKVIIIPRNYSIKLKYLENLEKHNSFIGTGIIKENFPLLYEATNEFGLSVAGLNFPVNCKYFSFNKHKNNLASYELIPYILSKFNSVEEAENELSSINITNDNFNEDLLASPLHWIIADKDKAIVLEQTQNGLNIYKNKIGILTNEPPFPFHLTNLTNYLHLSSDIQQNNLCENINLKPYSRGLGAYGLPGDLSSSSRFVRAAFTKLNATAYKNENESISQFFNILSIVKQVSGCVKLNNNLLEKTVYSSCCNIDTGTYYYNTYNNNRINAINMHNENLNDDKLIYYDMRNTEDIYMQN